MADDGSNTPSKEDELADEAFKSVFPHGLPPSRPAAGSAILSTFPLEASHVAKMVEAAQAGTVLNVTNPGLRYATRTHHRLAQLLAAGMDEGRAGTICNYIPSTVSILKSDPMFIELLDYYGGQVEEEWRTVVSAMSDLHEDVVMELRTRLETTPGQFTVPSLTELMKALSDRTGNGPTSNHNLQAVTVALNGDDIQRIKGDASAVQSRNDGQVRVLTEEDQRALESVFTLSAADVAARGPARLPTGEGTSLRAEDDPQAEDGVVADPGASLP